MEMGKASLVSLYFRSLPDNFCEISAEFTFVPSAPLWFSKELKSTMHPLEAFSIIIAMGTLTGSVLYLVRTSLGHIRATRTEKLQADLYTRLLDRFGSSQDLLAYLQTDAGKNLLRPAPAVEEPAKAPAPTRRIMTSVQVGTVLVAFGIGLLIIKSSIANQRPQEPLTVFGILSVTTGVGFLASAFASWKLSRAWGLLSDGRAE
jgi:hypothetical protein